MSPSNHTSYIVCNQVTLRFRLHSDLERMCWESISPHEGALRPDGRRRVSHDLVTCMRITCMIEDYVYAWGLRVWLRITRMIEDYVYDWGLRVWLSFGYGFVGRLIFYGSNFEVHAWQFCFIDTSQSGQLYMIMDIQSYIRILTRENLHAMRTIRIEHQNPDYILTPKNKDQSA